MLSNTATAVIATNATLMTLLCMFITWRLALWNDQNEDQGKLIVPLTVVLMICVLLVETAAIIYELGIGHLL